MARYPNAVWQPLPENSTQPAIHPTQFIVHTAVDHPGKSNLWNFFARNDVTVESHFWIPNDGTIVQYIDTEVRADANLKGNGRAISVETEDDGDPERNPWTPEQVDALIDLIRWCGVTHKIPMEVMPAWDAPGVGWHSMWGFEDPTELRGPIRSPWTNSFGKTCPGLTRIAQLHSEVLPAIKLPSEADRLRAELDEALEDLRSQRAVSQRLRDRAQRLGERLATRNRQIEALRDDLAAQPAAAEELQQRIDEALEVLTRR